MRLVLLSSAYCRTGGAVEIGGRVARGLVDDWSASTGPVNPSLPVVEEEDEDNDE